VYYLRVLASFFKMPRQTLGTTVSDGNDRLAHLSILVMRCIIGHGHSVIYQHHGSALPWRNS
jgi:hypothetical protein